MHTKPGLRVFLKWMIARSGSVIVAVTSSLNRQRQFKIKVNHMRLYLLRLFTLSLFVGICQPSMSYGQETTSTMIEWKSTSGHSLTAELVEEDETKNTITLRKADGKQVVVPLEKLDAESRKAAVEIVKKNPTTKKYHWIVVLALPCKQ